MTRRGVTDEQYGRLQRRLDEVARRVDEGTIPFDNTMRGPQVFLEGKFNSLLFPIFLSIQLGTHSSINSLRASLSNCGHSIGDWANNILDKITLASTPTTFLNLIVVSNADLGFSKGATFAETCAKAKESGLDLCPAEVGPQLRLQYTDQPRGEWLVIAMEPIADSDGGLDGFRVGRSVGGRSWLYAGCGSPSYFWFADDRFVFVSRR